MSSSQITKPHRVDYESKGPSSIFELTDEDFETYLSSAAGRGLKLVYGIMVAPAILLAAVTVFLGMGADPSDTSASTEVGPYRADLVFTGIHIAAWCIGGFLAARGFSSTFSKDRLCVFDAEPVPGGGLVELSVAARKCVVLFTQAYVLRLAKIEGAALFGVVVCFLGVQQGWIFEAPLLWVNLLGVVALLAFVAMTFPSEERRREIFRECIVERDADSVDSRDEPALLA